MYDTTTTNEWDEQMELKYSTILDIFQELVKVLCQCTKYANLKGTIINLSLKKRTICCLL